MTGQRQLAIELSIAEAPHCVRLLGLPRATLRRLGALSERELARVLPVYPRDHVSTDALRLEPTAGRYEVDADAVTYRPRYPFVRGLWYAMVVHTTEGRAQRLAFRPSIARAEPTARVLATYPSGGRFVRNQLKLYVQFSTSMSEGQVARHVRIARADTGEPIESAFVTEPELWDRERRRLTLLFDPGRLKRGLRSHEDAGYPLQEGVAVRVVIDEGFRDADGNALQKRFEKRYEVDGDLRARVDPSSWECRFPGAGTVEALLVRFDRPLDHALLQHGLLVTDGAGDRVRGRPDIGAAERSWTFSPAVPWSAGEYRLAMAAQLEDLAGNSIARVFDRDIECDEALLDPAREGISFAL